MSAVLLLPLYYLQFLANPRGDGCHLLLREIENTIFLSQHLKLLLQDRHAGRQGSDVSVDVAIPLLAAQRQEVDPFRGHGTTDGFSDPVNQFLQFQVLRSRKVARDMLPVFSGCDECIANQRRVFVEKGDGAIVSEDDVMKIGRIVCNRLTDKARPVQYAINVALKIKWSGFRHRPS